MNKLLTMISADGTTAPQSVTCAGWNADPLPYHRGMHGQTNLTDIILVHDAL